MEEKYSIGRLICEDCKENCITITKHILYDGCGPCGTMTYTYYKKHYIFGFLVIFLYDLEVRCNKEWVNEDDMIKYTLKISNAIDALQF